MPRTARMSQGGICYHVINRANGGAEVFRRDRDFDAFIDMMGEASERVPMRLLAYCLMPNHFHFVAWPKEDGDLSHWMRWLTTTHVRRRHAIDKTSGHVWQGRYKSFPIELDDHLLTVLRYVERNPVRAELVTRSADWNWSSARTRKTGSVSLTDSPVPLPSNWRQWVDRPQTPAELEQLRHCVNRGTPHGGGDWTTRVAGQLGIEASLRPRGRPRKKGKKGDSPLFTNQ